MSIFKKIKEKLFFKTKKAEESKIDVPRKPSQREYLPPSVAERVIAENKAEKEAKEAVQRGIDRELKMKSRKTTKR